MTLQSEQRLAYLIAFAIVSIAVTGYFIGLQSPMNPAVNDANEEIAAVAAVHHSLATDSQGQHSVVKVVPATSYSEMHSVTYPGARFQTTLADLNFAVDPMAEVRINPGEKEFALQMRERNRAFNGAPPTIPHPVDEIGTQSCIACHGEGIKTETFRISKMSHQYLANCTQCHVESNPQHLTATLFRENLFVGLPAPTEGPRAYVGAPPMIPHSTWMRVDCASCHGMSGQQGIRSTHPWRQNCQQCHAPSSELNQVRLESEPELLPAIKINK